MPNQNQFLVYFFAKSNFGDTQSDFIKIGYTRVELLARQTVLQTGNEAPIREIGVIPFETEEEARREEKRIHSHFGAFRARGEWFYAIPRLLQFIQDYAVQHTELFVEDASPETEDSSESTSFGERLKERREEARMTQEQVAIRVGCTRGYISFLENNRGIPGQHTYTQLLALFGEFLEPTAPSNLLVIKMPDGNWIAEDTAIDTFIAVLKALGIEKIVALGLKVNGIPLIGVCEDSDRAQRKVEIGTKTYYIVSGTNTLTKKKILDEIADGLDVDVSVHANPKV